MATPETAPRPLRDLLQRLPRLPISDTQDIDFDSANPDLLVAIGDDAEITVNVLQRGVGAIGNLLAHSAVAIEDGSISADCVESLGYMLAELADLGERCMALTTRCRQMTYDYCPQLGSADRSV